MKIHQIFFPFKEGDSIETIPRYHKQVQNTQTKCQEFNYEYKLWNLEEIENLIMTDFNDYYSLFKNFRYKVQMVDFARYCILSKFGGIYLDCDVTFTRNIDEFFELELFFAKWANDKRNLPYIAVIGSLKPNNKIFESIILECRKSYNQKVDMDIYKKWRCRFVFQTTGHFVVNRVIKLEKLDKNKILRDCLYIQHRLTKKKWEIVGKWDAPFSDINDSDWMNQ